MKNKVKSHFATVLVFATMLYSASLFGQDAGATVTQPFDTFLSLQNKDLIKRVILVESDIKGSPYLNKDFILGKIITRKNIEYQNVPLRYNIYNDDMEFEMNKDTYLAIANPKSMREIWIGNEAYIYTVKRNKKGDQAGYYKLLFNGNTKLLARHNIVFREPTVTTGYKKAEPGKLEKNSDTFYFQMGDSEPQLISKKKDLAAIFGSESKKLESYIKKEKINIRKEEGLLKLVKFINE